MYCKQCGTRIPKQAKFCPQCGCKFGKAANHKNIVIVSIITFVLVGALFVCGSILHRHQQQPKRVLNEMVIGTNEINADVSTETMYGIENEQDVNGGSKRSEVPAAKTEFFTAEELELYDAVVEHDYEGVKFRESIYDQNERLLLDIWYFDDGSVSSYYEIIYNSDGSEKAYISRDGDGNVEYWKEYLYDEAGNNIRTYTYDADGFLSSRWEDSYDENGVITKGLRYDSDDNLVGEITFNEYEDVLRDVQYDEYGNEITVVEYTYDGRGRQLSCTSYYEGTIDWRCEFVYGDDGNLQSYTEYDGDGQVLIEEMYDR